MSFFKDFKEDFSQAMNELLPGEEVVEEKEEELVVNTLEMDVDAQAELDKLEGLFEKVEEPAENTVTEVVEETIAEEIVAEETIDEEIPKQIEEFVEEEVKEETAQEETVAETVTEPEETQETQEAEEVSEDETVADMNETEFVEEIEAEPVMEQPQHNEENNFKEEYFMNTEAVNETFEEVVEVQQETPVVSKEVTDEVAIITEGTVLTGNMESTGSIEIRGRVNGNVQCNGKLTVTGTVKGNATSSEFFADAAKVEGEINTDGTVKIGLGSVVVGNISATSAVIAGAIKGDIDVQGPVVVDTSAVVMGNIKSRSVQINNGAVIEGFCSQCYAEVDVTKLFD